MSLKQFGSKAITVFQEALPNDNLSVRSNAIWALGQLGGKRELKFLINWEKQEEGVTPTGIKLRDVTNDAIRNIESKILRLK